MGVPWFLRHQGRLELGARRDALEQQASRLARLVEENGRLSNLLVQAQAAPLLSAEQLRELLRLRNERRSLAEQTNRVTRLVTGTAPWEAHLKSPLAGTEESVSLESEGIKRERARVAELGAAVGISAEDASRFFDRVRQQQKVLEQKVEQIQQSLTGSPEEKQQQMRAAMASELSQLAVETLGDKGLALVQKLMERKLFEELAAAPLAKRITISVPRQREHLAAPSEPSRPGLPARGAGRNPRPRGDAQCAQAGASPQVHRLVLPALADRGMASSLEERLQDPGTSKP